MKRLSFALAIAALLLASCAAESDDGKENQAQEQGPASASPDEKAFYPNDKVEMPAVFEKVQNDQSVVKVENIQTDKVIDEQNLLGGKVIIYLKPGDQEQLYGAFESQAGLYELGVVGGMHTQLDSELLSSKSLELYGKTLIRIKGVFGAKAPVQNYFAIDEGVISPFLRVDTGHAEEVDLDGDGIEEIVSTHGLPLVSYIYKWDDGAFLIGNGMEAQ